MLTQVASYPNENDIELALETVIQKRPVLEPIVRSFSEILSEKTRIARQLESVSAPALLNLDPTRLLRGIPLLTETSLDLLHEQLAQSFRAMLTVLEKTFSHLANDYSSIENLHHRGQLDLSRLSRAYLDGASSAMRITAASAQTSEGVLALLLHNTLSVVIQALRPSLQEYTRELQWTKGYCPICGSMPNISYLVRADDLGSEFLKGGGGQKYLHCSLCGHDWRFIRNKCPACDTADKDMQLYFQSPEEHSERVDVCSKCGAYLPCIDLRESTHGLPMDMAALSMVYLDVWATEKGYHPMARTPWNLTQ